MHQREPGYLLSSRYEIREQLGAGGMGALYLATHLLSAKPCVIKLLQSDLATSDSLRKRLQREAEIAARIDSDHVVKATDFGFDDDGTPYYAMELLRGRDLGAVIGDGPLPVQRAVDLVAQACAGLGAAHRAGVVHRDVKPSNIFVCQTAEQRDHVKVLDFGVAKVSQGTTATDRGDLLGTVCYMAPEQLRAANEVDARADVYAVGVVLYECLAGSRPFQADGSAALIHAILYDQPRPLAQLRTGLAAELVDLVERCMARDPDERPGDAFELRGELLSIQRTLPATRGAHSADAALDAAAMQDRVSATAQTLASDETGLPPLDFVAQGDVRSISPVSRSRGAAVEPAGRLGAQLRRAAPARVLLGATAVGVIGAGWLAWRCSVGPPTSPANAAPGSSARPLEPTPPHAPPVLSTPARVEPTVTLAPRARLDRPSVDSNAIAPPPSASSRPTEEIRVRAASSSAAKARFGPPPSAKQAATTPQAKPTMAADAPQADPSLGDTGAKVDSNRAQPDASEPQILDDVLDLRR